MLNGNGEPVIFKPYDTREESRELSQEVYDIPSVEPQNTASIGNESPEPAAFKPMFKQQDGRPAYPSRSVPAKPEVTEAEDTDDSNKTVRPGTRYYRLHSRWVMRLRCHSVNSTKSGKRRNTLH